MVDHFSGVAAAYASYRPRYPEALFRWLVEQAPDHASAWDCGTGTGQSAHGLVRHFDLVVASDASAAQLRRAEPHPRIRYAAMRAEQASLRDRSMALVTVAQALHWFAADRFYEEAVRVLRPGGLLAVWSYGLPTVGPDVDPVIAHFHQVTLGPFWPPERALVDAGYDTVELPLPRLEPPPVTMEARWTLAQFAGYVGTWSAVARHRAAPGADPLPGLIASLEPLWEAAEPRRVAWPLTVKAGRLPR